MQSSFKILFFSLFLTGSCFGQIPLLDSDPTITTKVVYLDFDGQVVSGTGWDSGNTINALPSTMSAASIIQIWKRVSEDYWPFEVNITTDVTKFNAATANSRIRVVITPTSAWYGSAGGVAYVNSFAWGGNPGTPCWVFENMLSYSAKNIAEATSHEVGHTLSLRHQSTYSYTPSTCTKTAEYNPGQGTGVTGWAPIMGVGYSKNVTVWYNGKSATNCNLIQNDHGSASPGITGNNFLDFRVDDVGNTLATSKIMNLNTVNVLDSGLVTEPGDVDGFKFTICYNRYVSIDVKPWALDTVNYQGANLDVRLFLYNAAGTQLAVDSPLTKLNARIGMNLTAGTYWFKIDGGGSPNYSDYGSLGRYYIDVYSPNPPLLQNTVTTTGTVCSGQSIPLTYTTNGFVDQWLWTVSGATTGTYTSQTPTVNFSPGLCTINFLGSNSIFNSCTTSATLNVNPTPQLGIIKSSADELCAGTTITLTASGATSYTWSPGGSNSTMQVITPAATSMYSLTGTTGNCSSSQTISIAVTPAYTLAPSASETTICPGQTATITTTGAPNYEVNPGSIFSNPALVSPTATTTYTITGFSPTSDCFTETTITIALKECEDVGINQLQKTNAGIRIYPNPAHGWLMIESTANDQHVEIISATGQMISSQPMTGKPLRITTESWASGIYFVKLVSKEGIVYTEKVVVGE